MPKSGAKPPRSRDLAAPFRQTADGITIDIWVMPRSSGTAWAASMAIDSKWQLALRPSTARPMMRSASRSPKAFSVPKSRVEVIFGHKGRQKPWLFAATKRYSPQKRRRSSVAAASFRPSESRCLARSVGFNFWQRRCCFCRAAKPQPHRQDHHPAGERRPVLLASQVRMTLGDQQTTAAVAGAIFRRR